MCSRRESACLLLLFLPLPNMWCVCHAEPPLLWPTEDVSAPIIHNLPKPTPPTLYTGGQAQEPSGEGRLSAINWPARLCKPLTSNDDPIQRPVVCHRKSRPRPSAQAHGSPCLALFTLLQFPSSCTPGSSSIQQKKKGSALREKKKKNNKHEDKSNVCDRLTRRTVQVERSAVEVEEEKQHKVLHF